jgi:hypothetical protein
MPVRSSARVGSELFIVDNSQDDWNVLRYLHDWCQSPIQKYLNELRALRYVA